LRRRAAAVELEAAVRDAVGEAPRSRQVRVRRVVARGIEAEHEVRARDAGTQAPLRAA
jgi:hypothetical protein